MIEIAGGLLLFMLVMIVLTMAVSAIAAWLGLV